MVSSRARKQKHSEEDSIRELIRTGSLKDAVARVEKLLAENPKNAEALCLKGIIFRNTRQNPEAIACFNQAVKWQPDHKEACEWLGATLAKEGKMELAAKAFVHLLKIECAQGAPAPAAISEAEDAAMREWFGKGVALEKAGDNEAAAHAFRKALEYCPGRHEALANLGLVLIHLHRYTEAEEVLMQCVRQQPAYAPGFNLLGNVYKETGRLAQAIAAYRWSGAANPQYRHPFVNLGKTWYELQHFAQAAQAYEQTLAIDPNFAEALSELLHQYFLLCRWDKTSELEERLDSAIRGGQCAEPFIFMVHGPRALQRQNAEHWSRKLYPLARAHDPKRGLPADTRDDKRLRIGYLSADFHRHATAALISELFELHDRARFSVYAYSYGLDDKGPERARIMKAVDMFRDVRAMDDRDAARQIEKDGIDILVDLKGYTQGHRLSLMAARAAPLQMHYLGYPGTMGAPFLDYFIADTVTAPPGEDREFSEALIRLPDAYQINDRSRPLPQTGPSRKEYGLPERGLVFGAFNNSYKIMPEVFAAWMRILAATEGSVLWLYEMQKEATDHLRAEAGKHGIAPERLITCQAAPLAEHLARYRHVDLCLDTTPVCGHTTTSDALWCAVPVVALKGNSFITRVSESLLMSVGLKELIAPDLNAYKALAIRLARDDSEIARLKKYLGEGRKKFALFDCEKTARCIEAAYEEAARRQREGLVPAGFAIPGRG